MVLIGVEKGIHLPDVTVTQGGSGHTIMNASGRRHRALKHTSFLFDTFLSQSAVKFSFVNEEAVNSWPPVL
jgi:hypothetical protein